MLEKNAHPRGRNTQTLSHTLPRFIWKCIQSNAPNDRNGHRSKGPDAEKSSKLPPAPFEVQEVYIDVQRQPDEKLKAEVCIT